MAAAPSAADPWTGSGGVGDYAASNGNTRPVLEAAHRIRDGKYATLPPNLVDTGELLDVVVVGGGIAGLTAAYTVAKHSGRTKTCLVLENHPIFGGEAKQNEFVVDGVRLVGPQGSNQFGVPRAGSQSLSEEVWSDFGLPREFEYAALDPALDALGIPLDNYAHMDGVNEQQVDVGYFFDESSGAARPTWLRNIWRNDLADTPFPDHVKRDLLRWRNTAGETTEEFRRRLDTMTYAEYLERELTLGPEVTRFVTPIVGLINGATPDVVSAFAAQQIGMPGVSRIRSRTGPLPQSFPGGNATHARHFVKYLVPDAISGPPGFEGVMRGSVDFAALDRPGQSTRLRVGATVIRVQHARSAGAGEHVEVIYEQGGRLYRTRGRTAVMASGGWVTKHVVSDLPQEISTAYGEFVHCPAMVVNVALRNWRFLYQLGAPACRWFDDGFGFSCNIRRPMIVGGDPVPALHPDRPTILTFYMGLYTPGKALAEQGPLGRQRLLDTTYADHERRLRRHMVRLFASAGFDARRDIAGIILNRWGHARLVQPPGFYYGRNGRPAGREVVERGFGRIAIGHSELNGHQNVNGAMAQGQRAALQVLGLG